MTRALTAPIALVLLAVLAPGAQAATKDCRYGRYQLGAPGRPAVEDLQARNVPRASGYAPSCLVAETVAARVQSRVMDGRRAPRRVRAYGARWSAGTFRCSYRAQGAETAATCRKIGRARRQVTFRLVP